MHCDEALPLLNARLAGELLPAEAARVDDHLATCAACRATEEDWRRQDGELRRLFDPCRATVANLAERVIAEMRTQPIPLRPRGRSAFRDILIPLFAAAAGFLVAVILFRPWERAVEKLPPVVEKTVTPVEQPQAQLVVATGTVEACAPGRDDWSAMPTGVMLVAGCKVRTGPKSRCEFRCPDGSEVRLNTDTEVRFDSTRQINLVQGQVWSNVAKAPSPFQVHLRQPQAVVTALGTRFDLNCLRDQALLTVVDGETRVSSGGTEEVVKKGQVAKIVTGQRVAKERVDDLLTATKWVHELLVLKAPNNPELVERVNDLFAQIGQTKASYLYEDDIRALGCHCVLPLTRYVQSDRSKGDPGKRRMAARILADLAMPWSVEDLIGLLNDRDADVRASAATALKRLTKETFGMTPTQWGGATPEACQKGCAEWSKWWQDNQERFPKTYTCPD